MDRFCQYRVEKENDSRGVTLHIALLMKLVDEDGNKVKNQYAHLNLLEALERQIKVKVRLDFGSQKYLKIYLIIILKCL